jgi:O-antigen ligase
LDSHDKPGRRALWCERVAFALLLLYIAVSPFPYGAVLHGGAFILETFAFAIALFAFVDRPHTERLFALRVPIAGLAAIALLGVFQLFPIPEAILGLISPTSAEVHRDAAAVMHLFGRSAPLPRISVAPSETSDTILLTLAYLALFTSAIVLLRSRLRRRLFIAVFLTSAALHVIAGSLTRAVSSEESGERFRGAFVNANHFSGYLEIALAVAFGVLWREVLYNRERARRLSDRVHRFEIRLAYLVMAVLLWGVFAAGIALTKSRAGIATMIVMTIAMLSLALTHRLVKTRRWGISVAALGATAAGVTFVVLAVRQQPILRYLAADPRDPASDMRARLWQLSLSAWREFPLFGSGLGCFREAFRRVQPRDIDFLIEYAHNDALQLLVTGGIIGFLLGATAILGFFVLLYRRWSKSERREESAFMLGGLGALAALLLHGLAEFNFSIPAIPATLACVMGMAWAASQSDGELSSKNASLRLVKKVGSD